MMTPRARDTVFHKNMSESQIRPGSWSQQQNTKDVKICQVYPSIVKFTLCSGHVFTSFHLFMVARMHGHKNIVVSRGVLQIFLQLIFRL